MKNKIAFVCYILITLVSCRIFAVCNSDTTSKQNYIRVHFLYGSKPKKQYKNEELTWFGGILGGHVGIEKDSGTIFNFTPYGSFHVFGHRKQHNSHFTYHNKKSFYSILGSPADSVKQLCIQIPVTAQQRKTFDSLEKAYTAKSPYDYAFFGMRCGAAAYEVLSQVGVTKKYRRGKIWKKIFYPKKLRKRLIKMAEKQNWKMERQNGTKRRKWEKD